MTIAIIVEIMESYPLGLRLKFEGGGGDFFVDLTEECTITCNGEDLSPGDLRPGMRLMYHAKGTVLNAIQVLDD